jgi:hypothetical protein
LHRVSDINRAYCPTWLSKPKAFKIQITRQSQVIAKAPFGKFEPCRVGFPKGLSQHFSLLRASK